MRFFARPGRFSRVLLTALTLSPLACSSPPNDSTGGGDAGSSAGVGGGYQAAGSAGTAPAGGNAGAGNAAGASSPIDAGTQPDAAKAGGGARTDGGSQGGASGASAGGEGGSAGRAGSPGMASALDLNDVSFLYPLPAWNLRDQLLGLASAGAHGPLLSRSRFASLPELVSSGSGMAVSYESVRIVAARIDPCFPGEQPGGCVRQLRLVAQPIGPNAPLTTLDATVHLLYDLDAAAWDSLVSGVRALGAMAGDATKRKPLGVHPVMTAQGLTGPYAKALDALILSHAGDDNLSKVAVMTLLKIDVVWSFRQFTPLGAQLAPLAIPRLSGAGEQTASVLFLESAGVDARRKVTFDPMPELGSITTLMSTEAIAAASASTLSTALQSAFAIERPSAEANPRTLDCGTCHLITPARRHAERQRSIDTTGWAERFRDDRFDMRRVDDVGDDPRSLRAFGYFGTKAAVSQRVINESAAVAAKLSTP